MASDQSIKVYFYTGVRQQIPYHYAVKLVKIAWKGVKACGQPDIKEMLMRSEVHKGNKSTAVKQGDRVTVLYKDTRQLEKGQYHHVCHALVKQVGDGKRDWEYFDYEYLREEEDAKVRRTKKMVDEAGNQTTIFVEMWPKDGDQHIVFFGNFSLEELERA